MWANIYIPMATHAVDKLVASIISHRFIQFVIWELPTLVWLLAITTYIKEKQLTLNS